MKKKWLVSLLTVALMASATLGCGNGAKEANNSENVSDSGNQESIGGSENVSEESVGGRKTAHWTR